MKRILSQAILALVAGLALRLLFVLKYPANSGDTILYEQLATNWLKHHVYAMDVGGVITPVDIRMPGYPAVLAMLYAVTGRVGEAARLGVRLLQVVVDLGSCVVIAGLARVLAGGGESAWGRRASITALWMGALCPFTANYTATALTETWAIFFSALALYFLARYAVEVKRAVVDARSWRWLAAAGLATGVGTLFRPETPIVLVCGLTVLKLSALRNAQVKRYVVGSLSAVLAGILPLIPWAARNAITLHELQVLAPRNSNLPGELVAYGFMAWEKTWLYKVSDCYKVSWKLNDEAIEVENIPARAFDTDEEKERVAAVLETYNEDLTLTAEEDGVFAVLAKERKARYPLRSLVRLPTLRAVTLWFTPRIELLPVSGDVFPLAQAHEDDPWDQAVTIGLFLLNILYVGAGLAGAWWIWKKNAGARLAVLVLVTFVVVRTIFLTTLETPEPRYVLMCFPAVIALGAQIFALSWKKQSA